MNKMKCDNDPFNLSRFIEAQAKDYNAVRDELRAGQKRGHWMWYIFPQFAGLGRTSTSQYYAIGSLKEAQAYLNHSTLGPRLRQCTQLVCELQGRTVGDIFGYPDDLKFRSSMTLFSLATPENQLFLAAISKYYDGESDPLTVRLVRL